MQHSTPFAEAVLFKHFSLENRMSIVEAACIALSSVAELCMVTAVSKSCDIPAGCHSKVNEWHRVWCLAGHLAVHFLQHLEGGFQDLWSTT